MEERLPDGSQVFRASWQSAQMIGVATIAAMALMFLVAGLVMDRFAGFMLALGLLMLWMGWWLARPMLNQATVVGVGPEGVQGHLFKGHTIGWQDIESIEQQQVQGQSFLVLHLVPQSPSLQQTRSWLNAGRKRNLQLTLLPAAQRPLATEAVLQAFQRHGGAQAQRSVEAQMHQMLAQDAFEQRLREKTPSLWALVAVVVLNVGVWVANLVDGMSALQPETADLFRWGASSASAVVRDGEWWRLVTATVLHGGLVHLALNMWALWVAGTQVTRWFGNGQFLLIYWGSALAGSALSLHFSAQQAVSVGASGAVFGVLGALLAGVVQHRDRVPKAVVTQLLTSQGAFVAISLVQGFTRPGIDNAAHIGGLLAGAVMAWLLVEVVDETASAAHRRGRQWLAAAAAGLVVAGLVWAAPAGVDHRALLAEQTALREVLPAFQKAEQALQADAKAEQEGRISPQQLVEALEQRHMPAYRAVGEALARVPADVRSDRLDDLRGLQSGMLELMALEVGQARGTLDPAQAQARVAQVTQALRTISERMKARNTGG